MALAADPSRWSSQQLLGPGDVGVEEVAIILAAEADSVCRGDDSGYGGQVSERMNKKSARRVWERNAEKTMGSDSGV